MDQFANNRRDGSTQGVVLFPGYRRHPIFAGLTEDAAKLLAAIYLFHPVRSRSSLGDAEYVKAMADLHHAGAFRIVEEGVGGDLRFEMAPFEGAGL